MTKEKGFSRIRKEKKDCMAVVVDSIKDVRDYLDESGADISGMSDEELEEASEVFALPNGQYLIVEG